MTRNNGEVFPTEHYVTGIRGHKAKPDLVVSVVRDISARRRMDRIRFKW